ncbi:carbohydrate-binding X8 domain superfamily protein [Striga asiatica]|uniref:Carbohydrate-binding X8 domain superfamily protein n=1 Tax=Striga asiatica TaxID=4170 RepID=A0A5A7PGN4_STRAF|nr:carbohydrate-binding X8 domain superfamily protein [Striga asiatica]
MAVFAVVSLLVLAMAGYSDAVYCVCNSGLSDTVLQRNIDYACGNGADCTQIQQSGPCFSPNTVRDHCNYAVNSYFQRMRQASGSCDFSGTATVSQNPPKQAIEFIGIFTCQ